MVSVLLVEGATDVDFFSVLLRLIGLDERVAIRPPRDYRFMNTVTVFPELLDLLLPQLANGQLHGLGIVADADHTSGGGFLSRWNALTARLAEHGYRIPQQPPKLPCLGSVFKNSNGLPSIGLWLMPDHQQNGMLEDLILQSITSDATQQTLVSHARDTTGNLPVPSPFSVHQRSKAVVYSWLAWQARPGQGLDIALNAKLIDHDAAPIRGLMQWLQQTFQSPS